MLELGKFVLREPKVQELPQSLYAAFDTYPAPKGAAVHIREFAQTLFAHLKKGLLLVLGNDELPVWQIEENCEIRRLASTEDNYLQRAMAFSDFVAEHAHSLRKNLKIAHFRDPWGGIPILDANHGNFKTVYEVNALPSIELPARYNGLGSKTLEKIRELEKRCWLEADAIVCPSKILKECLINLGAECGKITIIPNGAQIIDNTSPIRPAMAPESYLIYFGAVQSWQGIEVLFKAMTFLQDLQHLNLVMCVSGNKPRLKYLQKLAERLNIAHRVIWQFKLSQQELQPWINSAAVSVAPLVECSRNLVQGCCPIKIIESMASGVPVIASDMPVVRELLEHNQTGWLVRPDRPSELARAIRILDSHPEERQKIGNAARTKAIAELSWETSAQALKKVYLSLQSL